MKHILIFTSLVFLSLPIAFGQVQNGDTLLETAIELLQEKKYEEAIDTFEEAIVQFKESNQEEEFLQAYFYIAYCLSRLQQSEAFIQYEDSIRPFLSRPYSVTLQLMSALAKAHNEIGNLSIAIRYFDEIIDQSDPEENFFALTSAYQGKSKLLSDLGNVNAALNTLERLLYVCDTYPKQSPQSSLIIANTKNRKGTFLVEKANFQEAVDLFHTSLPLIKNIAESRRKISFLEAYHNLGHAYYCLGEADSALFYLHKKLSSEPEKRKQTGNTYKYIGLAYAQLQQYDKAFDTLLLAQQVRKERYPYKHKVHAQILNPLGEVHQSLGEWETALDYHQQALIQLVDSFESKDPSINPKLGGIQFKSYFLETLLFKAKALHGLYEKTKEIDELELAFETVQLAEAWIDSLRVSYYLDGSKLSLAKRAKEAYALGMDIGFELWSQTKKEAYLSDLFRLSEKSKGLLLMEAFQTNKANHLAGLPQDSLDKEQTLIQQLTYLETKLHSASTGKNREMEIPKIKQQIFDTQDQLQKLTESLAALSPAYQDIRQQTQVTSLQGVQASLTSDQALLEYFLTPDHIYAFLITEHRVTLHQLKREFSLVQSIEELRHGIYGYHTAELQDQTDSLKAITAALYRHQGHQLYQQLLRDVLPHGQTLEQLIIIPDGVLGYVPFDALLREPVAEGLSYGDYPYLIQAYQISYCYSASLLEEMKNRETHPTEQKVLAVGISFQANLREKLDEYIKKNLRNMDLRSGKATAFPAISYATKEVNGLVDILPSDPLIDSSATETALREVLSKYQALHFSTHGILDSESEFSFLALANSSPQHEEDRLYVKEIYGLDLQADMVFLSACETGLGKLQEGEGIISLARGFSYAGAKSIITTLWSISDQHSSWIVHRFYTYIDQGLSKDKALQAAKQDYIQAHTSFGGAEQHPFYWAAFTPIGDMDTVEFGRAWWWNLLMAAGLLLMVVLVWRWKGKDFLVG